MLSTIKRGFLTAVLLSATLIPIGSLADNLVQVYQQAVLNDKTFAAAQAQYYADRENVPIARAAILPQFTIDGEYTHNDNDVYPASGNKIHFSVNTATYTLTLTDTLFNIAAWRQIASASSGVKASLATYNQAIQQLIVNTVTAYFNVLTSVDKLRWDIALEQSYLQELRINQEKFRVGLVAITPVYNTQAQYDAQVATVIADRTALANNMEALRVITGKSYGSLNALQSRLPLVKPVPNNINTWVQRALAQNYQLLSTRFSAIAAMKNIQAQSASRLPTLGLTAKYNPTYFKGASNLERTPNLQLDTSAIGVALNFPLFQGGAVFANTRQARYQYDEASAQMENQSRLTVQSTRNDFLSVVAGISTVKADRVSIISSQKSLETDKASWIVGTRTILDVLNDYASLYGVKTQYSQDQYSYLLSTIKLKQDAGILSLKDVQRINRLLTQKITFIPLPEGDYRVLYNNRSLTKMAATSRPLRKVKPRSSTKKHIAHQSKPYSIAFYTSRNRHGAKTFIAHRDRRLRPHLRIRTLRLENGKTGYQVVYGHYTSRASAKSALARHSKWQRFRPYIVKITAKPAPTKVKAAKTKVKKSNQPATKQAKPMPTANLSSLSQPTSGTPAKTTSTTVPSATPTPAPSTNGATLPVPPSNKTAVQTPAPSNGNQSTPPTTTPTLTAQPSSTANAQATTPPNGNPAGMSTHATTKPAQSTSGMTQLPPPSQQPMAFPKSTAPSVNQQNANTVALPQS